VSFVHGGGLFNRLYYAGAGVNIEEKGTVDMVENGVFDHLIAKKEALRVASEVCARVSYMFMRVYVCVYTYCRNLRYVCVCSHIFMFIYVLEIFLPLIQARVKSALYVCIYTYCRCLCA
jgi:hypothetical protein